ncbi:hypothetical protein CHISP_1112 [Chitinispirillum alkaliphilum]|nr:hypothetical protein CHISP_1112 [Chitinispirillum alkaliphilum]
MGKNMIFHIPAVIDSKKPSGPNIRPLKMIAAFRKLGYNVHCVMGTPGQRRKKIKKIRREIREGKKYSFLYSESWDAPTLFTHRSYLPSLCTDFALFSLCSNENIPVGLFYRDVYWAVKGYTEGYSRKRKLKQRILRYFYLYDIWNYNRYVDILYLPSLKMRNYIPAKITSRCENLPPGLSLKVKENTTWKRFENTPLRLVYVGGINKMYDITLMLRAVSQCQNVTLTICCREEDWKRYGGKYRDYMNEKVQVVHKKGDDLESVYNNSDVACLLQPRISPFTFAMPLKLFEYMEFDKPAICFEGTEMARLINGYKTGWSVSYDEQSLVSLLSKIDHNEILGKKINIKRVKYLHTWSRRAGKVADDLDFDKKLTVPNPPVFKVL